MPLSSIYRAPQKIRIIQLRRNSLNIKNLLRFWTVKHYRRRTAFNILMKLVMTRGETTKSSKNFRKSREIQDNKTLTEERHN